MGTEIMGPAGRLHVDDGGSGGLPVVFIHSFAGSSEHWTDQLEHLRPARRAVAFDLRGHGRSEARADDDVAIEDLGDDVGTVVEALGLERVALVGHSIGGLAAVAYAAANPERAAGMLLVGTPGRVPLQQGDQVLSAMTSDYDETMSSYWDRLLADGTPRVRDQITRERGAMSQKTAMALIRSTFAYDPLPALRDYHGPVATVTIGDSPFDLHKQLPDDVPDAKVEGTSHWVQMDQPAEFNQVLDAFLAHVEELEAAGRGSAVPAGAAR
jgi:pimeloyl-ACP methyl ester carboxylesterase